MAATVRSNDTVYMAREDGCACRSIGRAYRAVGMVADIGLRSKQGRGRRGRFFPGTDPSTQERTVSLRAKALITGGKRGREVADPACIVVYL